MSESLFPYYERELLFIRQLAIEFARRYPFAAARLRLEPSRGISDDPQVERLMESFALLAGRVHQKLDDEFPELTEAILGVLYPHYLAPLPSAALVQFELDPARAQLPGGFLIERGSRLFTPPVEGLPLKFRTGYPVTLWPLRLTGARLHPPPFPAGLSAPPGTAALLRLQLECLAGMTFAGLSLDRLRFYLHGDAQTVPGLYELLFNHATQVMFRPVEPDKGPAAVTLPPEKCLFQVGFEREESLLVYPPRALLGYRVLTELFAYPGKFLFLDLGGFRQARQARFAARLEVVVFLNRTAKIVEQVVDASTFRLGCTPVVNLFEQTAEPIPLGPSTFEYRIVPDAAHPRGLEVYSVESVSSTDPAAGTTTEYEPFYSFRHRRAPAGRDVFWYASRRASPAADDRGSEVYLHLVDLGFKPRLPADATLLARTLCTNRDLPAQLAQEGDVAFTLEAAAPLARVRCLRPPTVPRRPALRRGGPWRLISHLTLNFLSLTDPAEGLEALRDILRQYDFSDPASGQQQSLEVRELIEGIVALQARRVVGWTGGPIASGFARGVEVTLEFDEEKYAATGVYLFASALERFLGLYVSANSFSQLVARRKGVRGEFCRWPPRRGELALV